MRRTLLSTDSSVRILITHSDAQFLKISRIFTLSQFAFTNSLVNWTRVVVWMTYLRSSSYNGNRMSEQCNTLSSYAYTSPLFIRHVHTLIHTASFRAVKAKWGSEYEWTKLNNGNIVIDGWTCKNGNKCETIDILLFYF